MTSTIDLEIIRLMDEHVAANGGAVTIADTREAILPAVRELLAGTPRDLDAEATRALRLVTDHTRDRRRLTLKRNLDFILDGFTDPEAGAHLGPFLDYAYPLGTDDGSDKTLRNWTAEDFRAAITARYRNAATVTVAAKDFDDAASQLIARLAFERAHTLGDLLGTHALPTAA